MFVPVKVLIVNSDQLSLLENSQEIVVMQGSDPKTLEVCVLLSFAYSIIHFTEYYIYYGRNPFQVSVVRLNDESVGSSGEMWMLGQNIEVK